MVYKGCQRRIIMIKNPSECFEEAYFILKENGRKNFHVSDNDMIREANRIVAGSVSSFANAPATVDNVSRRGRIGCYLIGILCGIGAAAIAMSFLI